MSIISSVVNVISFFCRDLCCRGKDHNKTKSILDTVFNEAFVSRPRKEKLLEIRVLQRDLSEGRVDLDLISETAKRVLKDEDLVNNYLAMKLLEYTLEHSMQSKKNYYAKQYYKITRNPITEKTNFLPLEYSQKLGAIKRANDLLKRVIERKKKNDFYNNYK